MISTAPSPMQCFDCSLVCNIFSIFSCNGFGVHFLGHSIEWKNNCLEVLNVISLLKLWLGNLIVHEIYIKIYHTYIFLFCNYITSLSIDQKNHSAIYSHIVLNVDVDCYHPRSYLRHFKDGFFQLHKISEVFLWKVVMPLPPVEINPDW